MRSVNFFLQKIMFLEKKKELKQEIQMTANTILVSHIHKYADLYCMLYYLCYNTFRRTQKFDNYCEDGMAH